MNSVDNAIYYGRVHVSEAVLQVTRVLGHSHRFHVNERILAVTPMGKATWGLVRRVLLQYAGLPTATEDLDGWLRDVRRDPGESLVAFGARVRHRFHTASIMGATLGSEAAILRSVLRRQDLRQFPQLEFAIHRDRWK